MTKRRKYGWTAKGMVGMISSGLRTAGSSFFFLAMGVLFHHFRIGEKPGDPRIFLYVFGGMGAAFFLAGLWPDRTRHPGSS